MLNIHPALVVKTPSDNTILHKDCGNRFTLEFIF